jgi:phosphoglycerol transferase
VGLFANLAPNFVYLHRHGNPHIVQRNPVESEIYGLKLAPMLLPIRNHRITALAQLTERYSRNTVGSKASEMAALGLMGTTGFLFLTIWILFVAPARGFRGDATVVIFNRLGTLTTAAVLLGTVGGFSSLFALLVFPQIRSYHRISLYIAFFSLLAIAILVEEFFRRRGHSFPRSIRYVALTLIVTVGIFDQTSDSFVPAYSRTKADFANDEAFVAAIEKRMPSRAMIFQLPYTSFPEGAASNLMTDYELFRGYLHSKNLRWSYGAMKGRDGDIWLQQTSARPVPEMLDVLAYAGFNGIYIDRLGYRDEAAALEGELKGLVHQEPLVSNDKRLAFFDLTEFNQHLSQRYSPSEFSQRQKFARSPLLLSLGGCSGLEGSPLESWRWCAAVSDVTIKNTSDETRVIEIEMRFASGYPDAANLQINGPDFSQQLQVNNDGASFSKRLEIPPGNWTLMLFCDGKRVHAPADERELVFRIINLRWKELDRALLK